MIRRACGDSCVEHDVCMKEHEVREGCKKGAGAARCEDDA